MLSRNIFRQKSKLFVISLYYTLFCAGVLVAVYFINIASASGSIGPNIGLALVGLAFIVQLVLGSLGMMAGAVVYFTHKE